ncbi:RNA polymerase sigma factor [Stieleria neptunia]|uniref:RNA polymerase sigma factor n=1 Tax=Stieleria neptunia TaxID=2527979 RepID=A0A518HPP5_9BACT|nr:sigma-70 family RNA polymerase sigma factor [Stieleria neptunia]QDV42816.1 RNA polymerase sigma factor [Stieleria neptunia]
MKFPSPESSQFKSTQWSVILRVAESGDEAAAEALDQMCRTYWYPLYAYVRRRGLTPDDALDVTQGFFAQLLASSGIRDVHPEKGRFRAFLLASIKNYLRNHWRQQQTQRRGGGTRTISIQDEEFEKRYQGRLAIEDDPERQFERDWVEELLNRVLSGLRHDYQVAGREELYRVLYPFLTADEKRLPLASLAEQLGLSLSATKMSIHRIRKEYAERVRHEVAATLDNPDDVEGELSKMISLVRR